MCRENKCYRFGSDTVNTYGPDATPYTHCGVKIRLITALLRYTFTALTYSLKS